MRGTSVRRKEGAIKERKDHETERRKTMRSKK